jgi:hypothetical protein
MRLSFYDGTGSGPFVDPRAQMVAMKPQVIRRRLTAAFAIASHE